MSQPRRVSDVLLRQVCCPTTFQPLREAGGDVLSALNARIAAGGVKNAGGADVTEAVSAALLREDGKVLYPVAQPRPGVLIPRLLADEGICLDG
jgi:hypothetical protein